jgi:protein kinase A
LGLKDILKVIYDPRRLGKDYENIALDNSIGYETLERRLLLGEGSFGQVWLCRDPAKDAPYALKIQYKRELIDQHQAGGVIRETRVMQKMHHPFVMGLFQAQQDAQCLYMVMGVVQGGELQQQMRNEDRGNLSEPSAKFYAACILEGLSYMHRRNFIYRDLKGENVLLDKDGYCVIIDLGFAKHVPDKTFTFCGTPIYIAPEILLSKGHDKSADIWSFGVMIYEMLFGTNPFFDYDDPTINQTVLFKRIVKADFQRPRKQLSLDAYDTTSAAAKDLIRSLLVVKPNQRLGCMGKGDISIRNHPWFSDIDFGKLYRKEIEAPWVPEISDPFDGKNFNTVIPKTKSGLRELSKEEQKQFEEFGGSN